MFFSKVKIASVVLLIVVGTLFSTGTLMLPVSPAQEKDNQEKKAVTPAPAPQETLGETAVNELAYAYIANDALGDEKFTGKRLRVTGPWQTVRRQMARGALTHYMLTMSSNQTRDKPSFRFDADARKQLSELKRGEIVTIEGRCEGRRVEAGEGVIAFSDCKIVSVKPPPPPTELQRRPSPPK